MKNEKTYVFIPGGWHGGWVYDPITENLERLGKKCMALTLPGLEQTAIPNRIINLDTHIQFVVDFILKENLSDVILCGHSYAGLVITGVADKIAERIHALVYIDAYIPKNGDSCWSLTSEVYRQRFVAGAANDGFTVADRPGSDDRRRPHPLASFMQSLKLTGNYERIPNRTFIYLSDWDDSPFVKQYEDLKDSPDWHVETIHCAHNVMKERPDELVDILYKLEDTYKLKQAELAHRQI
ncbi:alpha/beta fold hydrolase [Mucilaginibacter jinjuensis]|uniref:Alpha/beta fold hydrolase n=1 Tax=Mucilaginibacter jinjuensis TaxID=1176721 RepID=A0ABY7T8C8_9SPHI|nr:alpha/beta fold hydrolase [Mucilaginibacter jinjuensis]WCT12514.1 alpha/beta fold hydrolase [Mucilaginibacter jinjuensis]